MYKIRQITKFSLVHTTKTKDTLIEKSNSDSQLSDLYIFMYISLYLYTFEQLYFSNFILIYSIK